MKPFYSIQELADLLDKSVFNVVDGLIAYEITPIHKGEKADLSKWEYPEDWDGGPIFVTFGAKRDRGPNPREVIVATDFLPEIWRKCIERASGETEPVSEDALIDAEIQLAELFDAVRFAQLEAMFPDGGKWKSYTERASRNGLGGAKDGRGMFNPYRAAAWWIGKGPAGWTWERCLRKLANNLPSRSIDLKHLLTGEYE